MTELQLLQNIISKPIIVKSYAYIYRTNEGICLIHISFLSQHVKQQYIRINLLIAGIQFNKTKCFPIQALAVNLTFLLSFCIFDSIDFSLLIRYIYWKKSCTMQCTDYKKLEEMLWNDSKENAIFLCELKSEKYD